MNEILLSVIITVYNEEKYIAECIESVISQSYKNLDIIIVDDGSTDASPAICEEYANKDDRIKVIHKENGGSVSARKAGTKAAKGQYITYIDGDDYVTADLYMTAMQEICSENYNFFDESNTVRQDIQNNNKLDIYVYSLTCFCNDEKTDTSIMRNLQPSGVYTDERLSELKSKALFFGELGQFGILPSMCSKIFRKDIIEQNLYNVTDGIRMGDDAACTYPSICDSQKIVVNNELTGYMYRQIGTGTQTTAYSFDEFYRIEDLFHVLYNAFEKRGADYMLSQLTYYLVFMFRTEMVQELAYPRLSNIVEKYKHLNLVKKLEWVQYMHKRADLFKLNHETDILVHRINTPCILIIIWYTKRR